jgi:hypothetical protein
VSLKNIKRGFKKLLVWQDAFKNIHGQAVKIDPQNLAPDALR